MICKKCIYWSPAPPGDVEMEGMGSCRRYPPPWKRRDEPTAYAPNTHAEYWCGEGEEEREIPRAGVM